VTIFLSAAGVTQSIPFFFLTENIKQQIERFV